ncbi:hypothetical protein EIN_303720 [Entamoeba invadens IP1]|uniref:Leucine rich repeat containing protein BspA family protein n=1 Tax=Entamoeba invadens IP1 TaxID=370355 RepID=A0A0A1UCC4_ENTIV|nr:hypothetical protein EIN_303720 [Entamoeba invadens IP1]ELP89928.1 hypothetical protein EIN_303720 [Entamoeba invadens IP1]|eukprot:XP_004256699.1 hypothetical protein EIN_303720 [Entamoeba invadens IP1]
MVKLESYHVMIVSKYFDTIEDFINLELVCKQFCGNMEKFHFNPIPLNSKTVEYFPKIETLHLWDVIDENFGNDFLINKQKIKDIDEFKNVSKKLFYRIIVWFGVDFETVDKNKTQNIEFKKVTYTQNDRKKFGNKIPSSVTSIGEECFLKYDRIRRVIIPSNITSIGNRCFRQCNNLSSVIMPSSIKSIGEWCFCFCDSLSSVTIPSSVTSIGNGCFVLCSSLTSITIPSSVTSIGDQCFRQCTSLSNFTIPSSVKSTGDCCFNRCSNLSSVIIPLSVISIGQWCFCGCGNLKSVTIPSSVTSNCDDIFDSHTVKLKGGIGEIVGNTMNLKTVFCK